MMIKIFLDDVRPCPKGWILAKTAWECIDLLIRHNDDTVILSLDHDLGDEENGTGYDVVKWIEEQIHSDNKSYRKPAQITVHSANPVGIKNMQAGIAAIYNMRLE